MILSNGRRLSSPTIPARYANEHGAACISTLRFELSMDTPAELTQKPKPFSCFCFNIFSWVLLKLFFLFTFRIGAFISARSVFQTLLAPHSTSSSITPRASSSAETWSTLRRRNVSLGTTWTSTPRSRTRRTCVSSRSLPQRRQRQPR